MLGELSSRSWSAGFGGRTEKENWRRARESRFHKNQKEVRLGFGKWNLWVSKVNNFSNYFGKSGEPDKNQANLIRC